MASESTPAGKRAANTGAYTTGHGNEHIGSFTDMQSLYTPALATNMLNQPGIMQNASLQPQMFHGAPYAMQDGQMVLAGYSGGPGLGGQTLGGGSVPEGIYAAYHAPPYLSHANYTAAAYMPYPNMMPFTPGRNDRSQKDVPGLENRRGSYSTTESSPATPFYGSVAHRDAGPRVAVVDRSNYTTPSPQQMTGSGMMNAAMPKTPATITIPVDKNLDELLKQSPEIPRAVPAVFTPPQQMKTLEQSLENRIPGNRNVYIRGLHPTTDDDLLLKYASRFGKVETSKAIIDTSTGACKGFGFAKFYDVHHSELCIRGFHRLGYEVGFARESFNSRLKAEGDESSANLYISNLPKSFDEAALGTVFMGYPILSSKILRDSMGNSRGVGFARFESRDICDEIIRKYNGVQTLGDERLVMQVRYADTPAQKELKRITAERRQFRTNEYNIGAYGTALVGIHPSNFQRSGWNRPHAGDPSYGPRTTSSAPTTTKTEETEIPDVSGLAVSDHESVAEENPKSGSESPTPVVANGSVQSSPSAKEKK
ncbi:RNA binding protein MSSP-2 [Zalerion maritima]|uniref:RNA binding protein MSSP-2 n=1 Tax=Zalerion maritima TaxID=339359 RepID=A0AAD5WM35_9PEZI|nr:RNA binding protein MSSP-2 [Zalerion maritima]